jgi:hypothetical protein
MRLLARRNQAIELHLDAREWAGAVGDVLAIMGHELPIKRVDVGRLRATTLRNHRPLKHGSHAATDQPPSLLIGEGRHPMLLKREVEGVD